MRAIKFRAFDTENKIIVPFVYVNDGCAFDLVDSPHDTPYTEITYKDKYVLMQYTGLKDKNGVEIYEGDVCKYLDGNWAGELFVVEYKAPQFLFCPIIEKKDIWDFWQHPEEEPLEVIGNIHEHEHLLNK